MGLPSLRQVNLLASSAAVTLPNLMIRVVLVSSKMQPLLVRKYKSEGQSTAKTKPQLKILYPRQVQVSAPKTSLALTQVATMIRGHLGLDELAFDESYNNLKVYEHELKGVSNSSSQNIAFLSTEIKGSTLKQSTADPDNIPKGYTQAASSKVQTAPNCASHSDEIICSFFAQQASMPTTHDDEDLLQIDEDAMEEIDIRWQVAMITARIRKFMRKTGRPIDLKQRMGSLLTSQRLNALIVKTFSGGQPVPIAYRTLLRTRHQPHYGPLPRPPVPVTFAMMALTELEEDDWSMEIDAEPVHFGQDGLGFGVESSSSKESDNSSGIQFAVSLLSKLSKAKDSMQYLPPTSDDEETALNFSEIQKKTVLNSENSETSYENRSPNSQNSVGQGSRKKGLGHKGGKTCFGNPEEDLKDYAIIDSGCSGSMTGDKDKLSDFKEFKVLILSPKFKFVDEDLVILRAPRKNDVYSLDLKNIIPSGGVTCLVAKATKDEAVLWHRRLGHVNFKNINKLVKGNLVRGLPSKTFKLDHSCLACRKGKQHRASCKKIEERTVREPLELLHMDLFGPVSVEYK
ncbi:putative ribonuclease H-like domain-containing protein [Tanacetum coccineum]